MHIGYWRPVGPMIISSLTLHRDLAEVECSKLRDEVFRDCHAQVAAPRHPQVAPELAYTDCLRDLCSCRESLPSCLCPVLAAYSDSCLRRGVTPRWRNVIRECGGWRWVTILLLGVHCPAGQEYQVCADPCTRSCRTISLQPTCARYRRTSSTTCSPASAPRAAPVRPASPWTMKVGVPGPCDLVARELCGAGHLSLLHWGDPLSSCHHPVQARHQGGECHPSW